MAKPKFSAREQSRIDQLSRVNRALKANRFAMDQLRECRRLLLEQRAALEKAPKLDTISEGQIDPERIASNESEHRRISRVSDTRPGEVPKLNVAG